MCLTATSSSRRRRRKRGEQEAGRAEEDEGEGGGWGMCIFKNAATVRHKIYLMKLKVALRTSL